MWRVRYPTCRQLGRVLRELDNAAAQFLLDGTVQLLRQALPADVNFGDVISLDTKHIIAWVQENNPKAYVSERYDKTKQPKGDPDCKLGCKKRHNRGDGDGGPATTAPAAAAQPTTPPPSTPTTNPVPARQASVGEYHRGYASGVVTTKVPDWGEFRCRVDPNLRQERPVLLLSAHGRHRTPSWPRPRDGALDKAYDAFYVYQYFHEAGGFAAVPFSEKGGLKTRSFNPEGLPLCAARLAMPLKFTFTDRTSTLVVHERGKYVCPQRPLQTTPAALPPAAAACPVNHERWPAGGCTTMMPISIGARLRYQLDREHPAYKAIDKQRTADEGSNSQAVELGIERPRLRRQSAITNQNTLIYALSTCTPCSVCGCRRRSWRTSPKCPAYRLAEPPSTPSLSPDFGFGARAAGGPVTARARRAPIRHPKTAGHRAHTAARPSDRSPKPRSAPG